MVNVFSFRVMDEANVPELWPIVRLYMLKVCERNGVTTLPEDVYADFRRDACSVLVLYWDNQVAGAMVVRQTLRDDERKALHVWALGTEPAMPKAFFHAVTDELLKRAGEISARSVSMTSARKGWGRFIRQFGWQPVYTTYEIEVPRGQEIGS